MTSHKQGNNGAVREENELKVSLMLETLAEHFWETHRLTGRLIHMLSLSLSLSLSNNLVIICINLLSKV